MMSRQLTPRDCHGFRESAVRLGLEHPGDYPFPWATISSLTRKLGCSPPPRHVGNGMRSMSARGDADAKTRMGSPKMKDPRALGGRGALLYIEDLFMTTLFSPETIQHAIRRP